MLKPYPDGLPTRDGTTYRHTDGGYYRFVTLARNADDQSARVIYQHIWPFEPSVWDRAAEEWLTRFKQVTQAEVDEACLLGNRDAAQKAVTEAKAARREREAALARGDR
jgi:Protein of unknown function (DUF1653)